jgi:uncharacterized pyridoxamine 5'-phosphate oxidase family protein
MKELSKEVISFFQKQGFVIVSTLDAEGRIHCSAKGIVEICKKGKVHLIDLYRAHTFNNLKRNPTISITAIDEHRFVGYTLKGKAKIVERDNIKNHLIKKWEESVVKRISKRVIKNVREDKKSYHYPEARFSLAQYLIEIEVEEVVNLAPQHLTKLS